LLEASCFVDTLAPLGEHSLRIAGPERTRDLHDETAAERRGQTRAEAPCAREEPECRPGFHGIFVLSSGPETRERLRRFTFFWLKNEKAAGCSRAALERVGSRKGRPSDPPRARLGQRGRAEVPASFEVPLIE
jgi:hypothetical protein